MSDFFTFRAQPRRCACATRPKIGFVPDGRTGHAASHLVRSPLGYRANFGRKGSSWRLMTFLAGD